FRSHEETIIIEIETEAPVIAPPRPIEAPRLPPVVEPATADDPQAVDTIPELLPFEYSFAEPEPGGMGDEGFVASSALPELVAFAKADYPELARRARIEGTVVIEVLVTAGGTVGHAAILQGVHPLLDKAALAAALRCRFTPARQRELAVPVRVAIPYRFRMN
ncbi:MAG: TonB family protein, partial [Candidatus Krumholzibacteriia bacterium]